MTRGCFSCTLVHHLIGVVEVSSQSYPLVIKAKVNIGDLPYLQKINEQGERPVQYHHDNWVENFPRILSLTRVEDALEINLFLEHRYKGIFMPPKRGGRQNINGGITLLTLFCIAGSMRLFLKWIEEHDVNWQEVYAVNDTEQAKYWLPVYRYRKYLIDRVVAGEIGRDTGNRYLSHVRQFYEWAFKQRRIDKIPFEYKKQVIKKLRKDGGVDLLFTNYGFERKSITVTATDLLIPKKYTQKEITGSNLSPYSEKELEYLYSTSELAKEGSQRKVDLACRCGLRAIEITRFLASSVANPRLTNKKIFYVEIKGKYGKLRTIMISPVLMQLLWQYRNSDEYITRLGKWQLKHGNTDGAFLFLNRSGGQIQAKSVGNIVFKARNELRSQGIELKRGFHDLRPTFATNLTMFMLEKHLPIGFIRFKLMQLMGHASFSTTQMYINFAESTSFDQQMSSWVDKLFGEFLDPLKENMVALKKGKKDE